ncbi:MAG: tRNA (adenosine(37)-N6)-threonylcarbamoyltransferase complex ATPase subunit type 1 TsaE [Micavibrio aeruginosavorus]|uniref:tRNA threonylcarbamoyladenosine biosynthesis protein TsaE n=1 Tax=Micavibrio aeruginosavorus TaxID=349221 RepID=A0A2W5FP40_9BACT|nr:MAG: tRNA (adenosine(37)-N6)-threonylcarbamoyltransferase complex ATPase subunit type 1 TsaE [Micavibrio aeruginosavorus]
MFEETISYSEEETAELAKRFAGTLPARQILFLEGDLAAGKSVFARALIRELAGEPDLTVPSPTFNLLQVYETPIGPVWHYDLYRLKEPDEIEELSWNDALSSGIVLIEWPERLEHLKPEGITVAIEPISGSPNSRKITIS